MLRADQVCVHEGQQGHASCVHCPANSTLIRLENITAQGLAWPSRRRSPGKIGHQGRLICPRLWFHWRCLVTLISIQDGSAIY